MKTTYNTGNTSNNTSGLPFFGKFGIILGVLVVVLAYFAYKTFGATTTDISLDTNSSYDNGLVLHWTFDTTNFDMGQTSAEVRDTSGQGRHGNAIYGEFLVVGAPSTTITTKTGTSVWRVPVDWDNTNNWIVAIGGGGGGSVDFGGGGGGAYAYSSDLSMTPSDITVSVGAGGASDDHVNGGGNTWFNDRHFPRKLRVGRGRGLRWGAGRRYLGNRCFGRRIEHRADHIFRRRRRRR